jgi:RNA polymerase sigma-54 factor
MVARQRLEQRLHLSQQMLQNLELLLLPAMELREFVEKELVENPVLEEAPGTDDSPAAAPEEEETPQEAAYEEMLERVEEEWRQSERRTRRTESAEDAERHLEMLQNSSGPSATLKEHLSQQLLLLELPDEMRALSAHVIEHVQDSGLLKASVEEMVTSLPKELLEGPLDALARKLENAIAIVQSLEPRGVGARSIKECLLLQLDAADPLSPLLRRFIEAHLEDVGANRLPHIVRAIMADSAMMKDLGREDELDPAVVLDDVKLLVREMGKLSPCPGARYSSAKPPRVFPEVVIRRVDGALEIILEDGWLPAISINRNYEAMLEARTLSSAERTLAGRMSKDSRFGQADRNMLARLAAGKRVLPKDRLRSAEIARGGTLAPEEARLLSALSKEPGCSASDREFLKEKVTAGRRLIAAIEQRRGTIYRITQEILRRQGAFFEEGIEHLRPLKMQEVADALGIHVSTVSRAVSEKWVETPHGILPLRFFFATAALKAAPAAPEGGTRLALLDKVRDILAGEDKRNPHSDLEIARILSREFRVSAARRTVAKYREELHFPSAKLRKAY